MTQTDCICQKKKKKGKKKEEDESPATSIAWMHQYKDSRNTLKRRKKDHLQQLVAAIAIQEQPTKIKMRRKTTVKRRQATNGRHCTREDMDMTKKENLLRETESFLIATQNKTIKINYIKEKIDNLQQNSK